MGYKICSSLITVMACSSCWLMAKKTHLNQCRLFDNILLCYIPKGYFPRNVLDIDHKKCMKRKYKKLKPHHRGLITRTSNLHEYSYSLPSFFHAVLFRSLIAPSSCGFQQFTTRSATRFEWYWRPKSPIQKNVMESSRLERNISNFSVSTAPV